MSKKYNAIKTANSNASKTFFKGAAVLSLSMVVVKLMGFLDKILINNLFAYLGPEYASVGSGLYSNAYELYIPLFTIATAGFPIAISRLISESIAQKRYKDVKQIHKVSIPFFAIMGTVCFVIMFVGSFFYIHVIESPYSLYAMLMLSPAILFGCLISIYRGYFEGQRNMVPTAISEIIEAGSKLVFGLVIAYLIMVNTFKEYQTKNTVFGLTFSGANADEQAMNTILAFSVAGAISGIVIGSFGAFLYLKLRYKVGGDGIPEEYYESSVDARTKKETFIRIFKTAIPIGLTALIMNLGTWIDSIVIQKVLYGMAEINGDALISQYKVIGADLTTNLELKNVHTALWGCYGAALPLMQMITAVTQVFGTAAMPNVASAWTKNNKSELKTAIESVLRITMLFALPAGLGLSALSGPIMDLVYTDPNVAIIGGKVLSVMGITGIFIAMVTPVCSMLQGIGRVDLPLKIYAIGITLKVCTTWMFVSNVNINIQGGSAGSLVAYSVMFLIAIYMLIKHSGVMPNLVSIIVKPLVSAVACAATAYFVQMLLSNYLGVFLSTVISILAGCLVYVILLLILRTFTKNDLNFLPKGKNIVTFLEKLHLIR